MATIKRMKEFNKEYGEEEPEVFKIELELTEEEMLNPPKIRELMRKARFKHENSIAGNFFREPHRAFFVDLVSVCGDISKACKECGVSRGTIMYHMRLNRRFRLSIENAIEKYNTSLEKWKASRLKDICERHQIDLSYPLINNRDINHGS